MANKPIVPWTSGDPTRTSSFEPPAPAPEASKTGSGFGRKLFWMFLLLLVVAAAGGVGYALYTNKLSLPSWGRTDTTTESRYGLSTQPSASGAGLDTTAKEKQVLNGLSDLLGEHRKVMESQRLRIQELEQKLAKTEQEKAESDKELRTLREWRDNLRKALGNDPPAQK